MCLDKREKISRPRNDPLLSSAFSLFLGCCCSLLVFLLLNIQRHCYSHIARLSFTHSGLALDVLISFKGVYSISLVTTCDSIEHATPLYLEEGAGGEKNPMLWNKASCFCPFPENRCCRCLFLSLGSLQLLPAGVWLTTHCRSPA